MRIVNASRSRRSQTGVHDRRGVARLKLGVRIAMNRKAKISRCGPVPNRSKFYSNALFKSSIFCLRQARCQFGLFQHAWKAGDSHTCAQAACFSLFTPFEICVICTHARKRHVFRSSWDHRIRLERADVLEIREIIEPMC